LLFEVVHEDALPFNKDSIVNDILFTSGNCYPYERTYDNVEEGNAYNRVNLRFYEQGASTLRTIYNKVRHAFFEKEHTNDIIVKTELRYIKHMVEASYLLLNKVAPEKYNAKTKVAICETLKLLLKDRKFQAHNAKRLIGVQSDSQDKSDDVAQAEQAAQAEQDIQAAQAEQDAQAAQGGRRNRVKKQSKRSK
jgi:hypothetical protein